MASVTEEGKLELSDEEMVKLRSEFGSGRASDGEIQKSVTELEDETGSSLLPAQLSAERVADGR